MTQNVGPDLVPNRDTILVFLIFFFFEKDDLRRVNMDKTHWSFVGSVMHCHMPFLFKA